MLARIIRLTSSARGLPRSIACSGMTRTTLCRCNGSEVCPKGAIGLPSGQLVSATTCSQLAGHARLSLGTLREPPCAHFLLLSSGGGRNPRDEPASLLHVSQVGVAEAFDEVLPSVVVRATRSVIASAPISPMNQFAVASVLARKASADAT